ncbi:carbon-nitrogen hydrolase family protein [Kiritimatiellota bacterium B12222]|nr:carbon-nitrogen hydrolase family protein [Kiritimatiellota bacterium B12222]
MSSYVHIAAPIFKTSATRGQFDVVLGETRTTLQGLRGMGVDLVVMCEGVEAFAQTLDTAETMDDPGPLLNMYQEEAVALNAHIAASVKIREGDRVYNSQVFVSPEGALLGVYHKCNLTVGEIDLGLSPGEKAVTIETSIGRLGGIICFDLNFRWLLEEYKAQLPDILCFGSMYHGSKMVQGMWAFECRSFLAAGLPVYDGGIVTPHGEVIDPTHRENPCAHAHVNLDRALLHYDFNHMKFQEIRLKYGKEVRLEIPPHFATALLYSESSQRTAADICNEFELELLDDYFDRSLKRNATARGSLSQQRSDMEDK